MAELMTYGGGGLIHAHRLAVNAGSTGYDVKQSDGLAAATTNAHATLIAKGYIEQSALTVAQEGGKIACTNYDMQATVDAGLKVLSPLTGGGASSTVPAAIVMEHGPSRGGGATAAGSPLAYWVYYGYLDNADSEAAENRWMLWGIGRLDPSSHNRTNKQGNYTNQVITFNPEKPEYAFAGASGLVDPAYITAVALPLAQYQSVDYGFFPIP